MAYTHLKPGMELEVSERTYFYAKSADLSSLVCLSPEELKKLEEESVAQEQAIYERVLDVVQEWVRQAGRTLDLRKAQEYLRIQPTEHTSNQWTVDQYERHEMSNMVYRFSWREYERTSYDRTVGKSVPLAWELSWSVTFNTTHHPDHTGHGWKIAGQDRKVFKDKAAMEKYLQGRIAAYAHLFTEISPPIPEEARGRFCVNGVLLPGYTVETPQLTQPDPDTVDDLLSYLDDGDIPDYLHAENRMLPPDPPPPKAAPKKVPHKRRNSAPTR